MGRRPKPGPRYGSPSRSRSPERASGVVPTPQPEMTQEVQQLQMLRTILGGAKQKAKAKAKERVDPYKQPIEDLRKAIKFKDKEAVPLSYKYIGSFSTDDLRACINYMEPLLSLGMLKRGPYADHWVSPF